MNQCYDADGYSGAYKIYCEKYGFNLLLACIYIIETEKGVYKVEKNNRKTVLVCVTAQRSSEMLVKVGKSVAEKSGASLEVVSVLPIADSERPVDCEALESIYRTAKNHGGETAVYFSNDPILTVAAHIAKRKPLTIVTGFPGEKSIGFISAVHLMLPEIPVTMVDGEGKIYNMFSAKDFPLSASMQSRA